MKCLICGSKNVTCIKTSISPFINNYIERDCSLKLPKSVNICYCSDCTFAFYDYRFNNKESYMLYSDYRGIEYQRIREKYECWYTKKINDALNNDDESIKNQQVVIEKILKKNIKKEIMIALDYGGNEGKTFTDLIGTKNKYVYDISNTKTIDGVQKINSFNKLKENEYDFIMCNMVFEHLANPKKILDNFKKIGNKKTIFYIEVPSENPFVKKNKFSIINNYSLLFNPLFNKRKLIKYYFKTKKEDFMPMKEHINFFTIKSMKVFLEKNGFTIIDICETKEKNVLGNNLVLSALFKIK